MIEGFWSTPIDYEDPIVIVDSAPFIVTEETPLSKIHFLFMMLGITSLTVIDKGDIKGLITKSEFIKKRKDNS